LILSIETQGKRGKQGIQFSIRTHGKNRKRGKNRILIMRTEKEEKEGKTEFSFFPSRRTEKPKKREKTEF